MIHRTLLSVTLIEPLVVILLRIIAAQEHEPGATSGDQSVGNIAFDLPDLTATVETPTGTSQLEAFKSTSNDQILRDTSGTRTSELFWVSVGLPTFIGTQDPRNQTIYRLFHFSSNGFSAYAEMMSTEQRSVLADTANTKYRVEVSENQVVNLILSRFQCTLLLYDDVGSRYILTGKVSEFRKFPLRMDFVAPGNSLERKLFTGMIGGEESMVDFQFDCSIESSGRLMKTNTLMVSADQQQQIGLEEKLFGTAGGKASDEVYVTRDQMALLATEMYTTLNIVEDYQMPEVQFRQAFVDGLITQVSSSTFAQVDVDTALKSLSRYGFDIGADIKPDVIKKDIGEILEIQAHGSKTRIILNETAYRQFNENQAHSGGGNLGFLKLSASANWANTNSKSSVSDDRSLSDQLRELNTASRDDVQWYVEGMVVRPKSLNVARLTRSRMRKTLTFNRVRIQTFNAPFQRNFAIYTLQATGFASLLEQLTARVTFLESIIEQMRENSSKWSQDVADNMTVLSTQTRQDLVDKTTALTGAVQQLSAAFNQKASALDAQIQGLGGSIGTVRSDLTASINAVSSTALRRCRLCVLAVGGADNCPLNQLLCSAWSDADPASFNSFLQPCLSKWTIECQV